MSVHPCRVRWREVWKRIRSILPCSQVHLQCCLVLCLAALLLLARCLLAGWLAGWLLAPLALALLFRAGTGTGASPTRPRPHPLPLPLPRPAAPSVPRRRPCLSRRVCLSLLRRASAAASTCPQSHCLYFPRCSPPFVLRLVLPPAACPTATRPVCFLPNTPYIHPLPIIIPTYTRPTSCALLSSTAPPPPWPARYTSNREAMFTTCAHGRPTVPC